MKKLVSVLLAVCLLTGSLCVAEEGQKTVTRAEFAGLLVSAVGAAGGDGQSFLDVPAGHPAEKDIRAAVQAGFIHGYEDGTFRPDQPVTGEDAVTMALSAFGVAGLAYPVGYLGYAVRNDILTRLPIVPGEPVDRETAESLLRNVREYQEKREMDREIEMATNYYSGGASTGGGGGIMLQEAPAGGGYPSPYAFPQQWNTEEYTRSPENVLKSAAQDPLSTFSIDVDTASYSNMRRNILQGNLPQLGAVRTEELVNYFDYTMPESAGDPVAIAAQIHDCPWNPANKLAMVALKGKEQAERPAQNLVFLVDVSGSMYGPDRLGLVRQGLSLLIDQLTENDRISIVTYASGTRVVLDGINGLEKEILRNAVMGLAAGGGTAGGAGLQLAYDTAQKNKVHGNNRIILCSDGDFNVGISSTAKLESFISKKRETGIYLSVLGFGMGNYKDNRMETLADKGNGNYAYIDSMREAKKVFIDDLTKMLLTVAEDVKIQVEFNPEKVGAYRLIGYENRKLENADFTDDQKDAGELGAGKSVIAMYELAPAHEGIRRTELRYQTREIPGSAEWMCVSVRYKDPGAAESKLVEYPVTLAEEAESADFRFASAVAGLGMLFNGSEYLNGWSLDDIIDQASGAIEGDPYGYRTEFIQLAGIARYLERKTLGEYQYDSILPAAR